VNQYARGDDILLWCACVLILLLLIFVKKERQKRAVVVLFELFILRGKARRVVTQTTYNKRTKSTIGGEKGEGRR